MPGRRLVVIQAQLIVTVQPVQSEGQLSVRLLITTRPMVQITGPTLGFIRRLMVHLQPHSKQTLYRLVARLRSTRLDTYGKMTIRSRRLPY